MSPDTKEYTLPELRDHVLQLAKAFDVHIAELPWLDDKRISAVVEYRIVAVLPIVSVPMYVAAMHEMGHIVSPTGSLWREQRELEQSVKTFPTVDKYRRLISIIELAESSAWEWAHHYHLGLWTTMMASTEQMSTDSYLHTFDPMRDLLKKAEKAEKIIHDKLRKSVHERAEALKNGTK